FFSRYLGFNTPDNQPMWRCRSLRKIGGYKHVVAEDLELILRALIRGLKLGFVDTMTEYYRLNYQGLSLGGQYSRFVPTNKLEEKAWIEPIADELKAFLIRKEICPLKNEELVVFMRDKNILALSGSPTVRQANKRSVRVPTPVVEILTMCDGHTPVA